ncbi:MerR family transcriptional regulator [Pseudomonas entomophila]|jgi:DNA-binding transcriptional MerR regulator|uniref:MerR family transcriptional regulator n=1 Tax=Pseudomonas entomophila TaxID=312306 RepID=UPI0015E468F2|nr:MerR family transcriptional regulator [Pseudomonas entomophila]MBA1191784.1 MerR family transcriptional regulator [Pseudomonas entomophila]
MSSETLLPIRDVARLTGVNPVTLRAWERRYGLIVPQRTAKGHRLYSQEQLGRVRVILGWLDRGASVGQVRALLEQQSTVLPELEGEWQTRARQLIDAIGRLSQRALDQQLNQAMALYPAITLCERLLLPVLEHLAQRWQPPFEAELETVFFHGWLRSKLGARVYHDVQSLEGPAVLLATDNREPFDAHFWLAAWLLSSSGQAVETLEQPVTGRQLQQAVERLTPCAVMLHLGRSLDVSTLRRTLEGIHVPVLLGGPSLALHRTGLQDLAETGRSLFDTPHAALRHFQAIKHASNYLSLPDEDHPCN